MPVCFEPIASNCMLGSQERTRPVFRKSYDAQPELVAHHFTEAGLSDAAIEYWQRAGDLAMARSGHTEAIHHFSVALDLLTKLGEKPDRAAKELELCVKLGPALMMVKGTRVTGGRGDL